MRQARQKQLTLTADWLTLDRAKELQTIAGLLDANPTVAELGTLSRSQLKFAGRFP